MYKVVIYENSIDSTVRRRLLRILGILNVIFFKSITHYNCDPIKSDIDKTIYTFGR